MQPPPLKNDIPCCLVVDTSALLDTRFDAVELLTNLLPSSPHTLVIPEDVLAELRGLTNSPNGTVASQAESVLHALAHYPDFGTRRQDASPGQSRTSSASGPTTRTRGVAVLQRPKETFYPLKKFARNRDTKIVACACYFMVDDRSTSDNGEASTGPARRFHYESAFFVTDDVVQQIKASPYHIPTIDTANLKLHWGHLGHWEP